MGFKNAFIAKAVDKSPSAISREIRRNQGKRGYSAKQAQKKASERRAKAAANSCKLTKETIEFINDKLALDWSPEQIAGYMSRAKKEEGYVGNILSRQAIYDSVWQDKKNGGELYKRLRRANGRKRRKKYGKADGRGKMPNRKDISERPKEVESREVPGHVEADLVAGAQHKGFLVTLVERTTRLLLVGYVLHKTAEAVTAEIKRMTAGREHHIKTITFDNGKEFSGFADIEKALDCECYFARPYCSQDRGTNENTNGLLRQYFPKGMPLDQVTEAELRHAQNRINSRPRKMHGYHSAEEMYQLRLAA